MNMEPNRSGKVTEYKDGHYYLTHTEWEDGHTEIEIHICMPQLLWHSCDPKQFQMALGKFEELARLFIAEGGVLFDHPFDGDNKYHPRMWVNLQEERIL